MEPSNLHEALHALRGELGVVRGNAELLQISPASFTEAERRDLLGEITRAAEKIDALLLALPSLGEAPR